MRSSIQKQTPRRYGNDDVNVSNGSPFDGSPLKSHKRYSSANTTNESKKYDDSTPPPRTRMSFSYGAKDDEIIDLQRELEQANKRTAAALSQQRYDLKLFCESSFHKNS